MSDRQTVIFFDVILLGLVFQPDLGTVVVQLRLDIHANPQITMV